MKLYKGDLFKLIEVRSTTYLVLNELEDESYEVYDVKEKFIARLFLKDIESYNIKIEKCYNERD